MTLADRIVARDARDTTFAAFDEFERFERLRPADIKHTRGDCSRTDVKFRTTEIDDEAPVLRFGQRATLSELHRIALLLPGVAVMPVLHEALCDRCGQTKIRPAAKIGADRDGKLLTREYDL